MSNEGRGQEEEGHLREGLPGDHMACMPVWLAAGGAAGDGGPWWWRH
jgi:hypothetical protein